MVIFRPDINYAMKFLLTLAGLVLLISCDSKKSTNLTSSAVTPKFSIGASVDGVSHMIPAERLDQGTIESREGVKLDARSMIWSGKYFYFYNRSEKRFYQYELKSDGSIALEKSLSVKDYVPDWAYSQNLIGDSTLLIMDPVKWGDPEVKWLTIRIPDFEISDSGSFSLPLQEQKPGVYWKSNIGKGVIHAGKFLMGTVYYDFNGNFMQGSHLVAFDYPKMTNPTLISTDITSSELGIVSLNGFAKADNGDLYILGCRGKLWGVPTDTPVFGGILRVNSGTIQFDKTYFLDLSEKTGEPTNIIQLDHTGGDTAIAILMNDTRIKGWNDISGDHYYFARLHLASGQLMKYNMPLADLHSAKMPMITGNQYITFLKNTAGNSTHMLEIDLNGDASSIKKGALIKGKNVKGYSVVRHPAQPALSSP